MERNFLLLVELFFLFNTKCLCSLFSSLWLILLNYCVEYLVWDLFIFPPDNIFHYLVNNTINNHNAVNQLQCKYSNKPNSICIMTAIRKSGKVLAQIYGACNVTTKFNNIEKHFVWKCLLTPLYLLSWIKWPCDSSLVLQCALK